MRDYGNIPELAWEEEHMLERAKLQIKRLEPLSLLLPDSMDLRLDPEQFDCHESDDSGLAVRCDPTRTMRELSERNQAPALAELGAYIDRYDMTVDVDPANHRIVVHT